MSTRRYRVDGEIGRFQFDAYEAVECSADSESARVSALFAPLSGKSWYRTTGFKEVAYVHGSTSGSYRKTSAWLQRLRYQPQGSTPTRTLQDNSQREGSRLLSHLSETSEAILKDHDFTPSGIPLSPTKTPTTTPDRLPAEKVLAAIEQCHKSELIVQQMQANPVAYEDPQQTVNISVDDVGVKRQADHRPDTAPETPSSRKYAYQTVVHVENQLGRYQFNAVGLSVTLSILVAFLLHNDLCQGHLVFFADGQRSLHNAILNTFAGMASLQLILDWYHLHEKCKKQLSLACNDRKLRNTHLVRVTTLLWHGLVDAACTYLDFIDPDHLKNQAALDKLKGYFRRNQPHIPCYCVRQRLGLRNSSNRGEKANDLLVSSRQKHNGMSWSQSGSAALAALTDRKSVV